MPNKAENKAYAFALLVVFAVNWVFIKSFAMITGVSI